MMRNRRLSSAADTLHKSPSSSRLTSLASLSAVPEEPLPPSLKSPRLRMPPSSEYHHPPKPSRPTSPSPRQRSNSTFFMLLGVCVVAGLFFVVLTTLSICSRSSPERLATVAAGMTLPGLRGISASGDVVRRVLSDPRYAVLLTSSISKVLAAPNAQSADPRNVAAALAVSLIADWKRLSELGDASSPTANMTDLADALLRSTLAVEGAPDAGVAAAAAAAASGRLLWGGGGAPAAPASGAVPAVVGGGQPPSLPGPHSSASFAAAAAAKQQLDSGDGSAPPPPPIVRRPGALSAMMNTAPLPPAQAAAAAAAAKPSPLPPNFMRLRDGRVVDSRYTQQTCHLAGDESEICTYEGTFCFDGNSPVMVTQDPPPLGPLNPVQDPTSDCMDYRFSEASSWAYSSCRYDRSGDRPYDWRQARRPSTDHPLDLTHRYLGPMNRKEVLLHEVSPADVFADPVLGWAGVRTRTGLAYPSRFDDESSDGSFDHPTVPGLRVAKRARSAGGLVVDYIDSALWMHSLNGQAFTNPYMWFASTSQAFAAQRANISSSRPYDAQGSRDAVPGVAGATTDATGMFSSGAQVFGDHPHDGTMHRPARGMQFVGQSPSIFRAGPGTSADSPNTAKWLTGPQWDIPPLDNLIYLGSGGLEIDNKAKLGAWFAGVLSLSVQEHTRVFFKDIRSAYNATHLLCARRGGMPSSKPRMFTTGADAWMFRQYAYAMAGVSAKGVLTQGMYAPRSITILDRKGLHGRGIFNRDEVLAAAYATGLEVNIVSRMDHLSFENQVEIMSGTGILIAAHGAALMNLMFMPAHAVVIEVFPPLMKINVYRNLAATMGLLYYPIYTKQSLPTNFTQFMGSQIMARPEFKASCIDNNITSYDAMLQRWCNWASKTHPIVVPIRVLKRHLDDAVDSIGAFSLLNPAWKVEAAARQASQPSQLLMMSDDMDIDDTPELRQSYKEAWAVAATYSPKPL